MQQDVTDCVPGDEAFSEDIFFLAFALTSRLNALFLKLSADLI